MTLPTTIGTILDLSITLEQAAESFYAGLARGFAHAPAAATFWNHYAHEEAGHARWLRNLKSGLSPEKLRQSLESLDTLADTARRLLQTSPETLLAGIHDLDQAYQTAVFLENSETNTIFEFLVTDLAVSQRSRDFLREQIHNHAIKVQQHFPAEYAHPAQRLAVQFLPPHSL